jgi:hypothetical protein
VLLVAAVFDVADVSRAAAALPLFYADRTIGEADIVDGDVLAIVWPSFAAC